MSQTTEAKECKNAATGWRNDVTIEMRQCQRRSDKTASRFQLVLEMEGTPGKEENVFP
jgi:hypothetical protein